MQSAIPYSQAIIKRGLKYCDDVIELLHSRNRKLITVWCKEHELFPGSIREKRLFRITIELDSRVKQLCNVYGELKEVNREERRQLDNSLIELSCRKGRCMMSPNAYGVAVLFKNYVPGEIKCATCGEAMTTDEENRIEEQLWDMNIYTD